MGRFHSRDRLTKNRDTTMWIDPPRYAVKRKDTSKPGTCTNRTCSNWLIRHGHKKLARDVHPCALCVILKIDLRPLPEKP